MYDTKEAEALIKQHRFSLLPQNIRRGELDRKAQELLNEVGDCASKCWAEAKRTDDEPNTVKWAGGRGALIAVTFDPTARPDCAIVERRDNRGVAATSEVMLAYNPVTERFESVRDRPFTMPGQLAEKRNALGVIFEACVQIANP